MTPAQDILLAKRHQCDGSRVRRLLELLRRVNVLYADVAVDTSPASFYDPASLTTRLEDGDDAEQLIAHARARQSSVARGTDSECDNACRECTVVESQTVLMETTADRNEHGRLARAFANATATTATFVARRSASILQSTDPHYVERLFPHLLTFGIGGLSMERRQRYRPRAVVLHYLNVSSNRFAEDAMFKLLMFDYLAMKRVKNGVFLRVGQNPALATTAMRVTPGQLKDAMRRRAEQRDAWKTGHPRVLTDPTSHANTLLRSINAAASKMWGSNEERESMTRKVDSMTILYGAPSVFWTLTPNPDTSLVCAFWTGHDLPGGRPDTLTKCGEFNMPCPSEMSKLVMRNTVVQAQYYKLCCTLLIDGLFGWDSQANRPKAQRGIFGFVEALVYAVEQQGRLFVHHHGVAWVAGLPKTQSDWERLLASEMLRAKFEQYCASIFAAELPVYNSICTLDCPLSGCSGQLAPLVIPKKFKHVLKSTVPAPPVATCDVCGESFSESKIVDSIIDNQWEELDEPHKAVSTPHAVDGIRLRFAGLSRHPATANIQMSRLLRKDQVHAHTHTSSCVKGQTGTKCRYRFFRELVPATCLDGNDELVFRRRIGNQWLNPFVSLWRRVLHFNMDARVLWSGQSLQATRYALQYAMKRQTVLDNVAIVEMAFQRRVSRELALQTTEYAKGVGRLMSLAYSSSGVMEIGGPLATVILQEGEAVTFGCTFERLVIIEGLNILNNYDVEATVVSRSREMFTKTKQIAWFYRNWQQKGYRARLRAATKDESDDDSVCDDDDILQTAVYQQYDRSYSSVHYEAVPGEFYSSSDADMEYDFALHSSGDVISPLGRLLAGAIASVKLVADVSFDLAVSAESITRRQIQTFRALEHDNVSQAGTLCVPHRVDRNTDISVESYERAIRSLAFDRSKPAPTQLGHCASVEDVSAHFGLNYLQHVAFTLIAVPLLRRLVGSLSSAPPHSLFDDKPIIVTGAGGTGKSQIIAAVRALVTAWMHPAAVAVVASTGIAASSLQGTTMHSSVGLGINTKALPKHITSPPDALLKQWAPVHCVIADEVSMVDLGFFGLWEESLQFAKDNRDDDYGGLLVVLMFDHCQLRAVKGMPMYRSSNGNKPLTAAQDRGLLLYRKIPKTVYLTENMRFTNDPEWGRWLSSGRFGNWTPECRSFLASLADGTCQSVIRDCHFQTISTDNITRAATNELAIKMAVRGFGSQRNVYIIPAQLSRRLLPDEVARIRQLPDNHTGHIPLFFQVYIGMPVRIKANQCLSKGVANGATGTVYHIDWDQATSFAPQLDGTLIASSQPRNIYVDINNCPSPARYPAIPSHWPPSVMPIHQSTASIKIGLRYVSIKGFPIVPAFGTTVHGVQGETLNAVAITSLRPPHVRRVDPHALYVALSRLRTRQGLHWIGSLPTPDDFAFFRPDADVILEDTRLKRLAAVTLVQFSQLATTPGDTA